MTKILFSMLIAFLFNAGSFAAAGDVTVTAKPDKTQATVGDPVTYTVTLGYPLNYKLTPPEKQDELGPWQVQDVKVLEEKKDKQFTYINYTLAVFTTGQADIPPMTFSFTDDKNSVFTVKTESASVAIESVMGLVKGAQGLRDIKPPLSLRIPAGLYIFWLLVIAAITFGAWAWYRNYRKKLPRLPLEPAAPAVPPYQTAVEELEKLEKSGLVAEGRIKEFYIALTDIIRKFLGAVYSVDTLDKTTGEIYQELRAALPDKKALVFIRDFFDECDLVKFAKYRPDAKTAQEDLGKARKIVEG